MFRIFQFLFTCISCGLAWQEYLSNRLRDHQWNSYDALTFIHTTFRVCPQAWMWGLRGDVIQEIWFLGRIAPKGIPGVQYPIEIEAYPVDDDFVPQTSSYSPRSMLCDLLEWAKNSLLCVGQQQDAEGRNVCRYTTPVRSSQK